MACLIVIASVMAVAGIVAGAFFKISSAIRREDRVKWSLRSDPPSFSTQTARAVVGIKGFRWD